jgi:hypothetical protein
MEIRIEPMTLSDLAGVLAEHDQFWGERDLRFVHQRVFVQEFGDTCLTARDGAGRIAGYLIGFTTPRRLGYIHGVAVRGTARDRVRAGVVPGVRGRRGRAGRRPPEGDHQRGQHRVGRLPPPARLRCPAGR